LRRDGKRLLTDQRILGSGDFVERILAEADKRLKYQLRGNRIRENLAEFIDQVGEKKGINPKKLQMGSRRVVSHRSGCR
jgi:hypothetical protein